MKRAGLQAGFLLWLAIAAAGTASAQSDCGLARDLSSLHDRYFSFLSAQDPDLGQPVVRPLGATLGEIERLRERYAGSRLPRDGAVEDALGGALAVLWREGSGLGQLPLRSAEFHQHMAWRAGLARWLELTYCFPFAGGTSPPGVHSAGAPTGLPPQTDPFALPAIAPQPVRLLTPWLLILPAAAVVGLVIARHRRQAQLRSFRRYPIHAEMLFDTDGLGNVLPLHIVDMSRGGVKLRLGEDAHAPSAPVLLNDADRYALRLIWRNAHFAGLEFRRFLGRRELARILRTARGLM